MAERSITPQQMADLIGDVSESGVRKWMYSERVPRAKQMRRIAEVTDGAVTANDFIFAAAPASGEAAA